MKIESAENLPKTPKAQKTRQKIYETALRLFGERGYAETTLRDIAKEAGVSLGLTYRYFSRKEEIVLALYEELMLRMIAETVDLPRGTIAERCPYAFRLCMTRLQPYQNTLNGLFGVGVNPDSDLSVFGDRAGMVRARMWTMFKKVIEESTDPPKPKQVDQLATAMYGGYLIFILFWVLDKSEGHSRTEALMVWVGKSLKAIRPFIGLKIVAGPMEELSNILAPILMPKA